MNLKQNHLTKKKLNNIPPLHLDPILINTVGFDFEKEVELNLGDVPLEKEHHAQIYWLIYSNQKVSLHDEDLSYCDWLTQNSDKHW